MYAPATARSLARALAAAFLAGVWNEAGLIRRGRTCLAPPPRWLPALAREVLALHHRPPADRPRELADLIAVLILERPGQSSRRPPRVVRVMAFEPAMGRMPWPVPEIPSPGDLAARLGLGVGELEWLADARGLERRAAPEQLRNYRYTWLPRPGGRPRVIERPKPRLKAAQRTVLEDILVRIPAHDAAHGFVRGRSARTHAAAHAGRRVVLRLDLEDFFASIAVGRVYGVLRTAGYPEAVAHALAALTSNVVPIEEWEAVPRPREPGAIDAHHRLGRRLAAPHLPQGAPTSPALANLCAFSLDRRLSGLAARYGARYTRYADDLAFSGGDGVLRSAARLRRAAGAIARDEGFRVNEGKSQLMTDAGRQRLAGVVVNVHPNVARSEYDALKAILHNAARRGPAGQNRAGHPDFQAHLLGRISWVGSLNPGRGAKLRERFAAIAWE